MHLHTEHGNEEKSQYFQGFVGLRFAEPNLQF